MARKKQSVLNRDTTSVSKSDTKSFDLSTQDRPLTKIVDQFRDGYSGRMKPISEAFVEKVAEDLRNYVGNNPRMLSIEKFCDMIGMHRLTFDRLANKFEVLGHARAMAIQKIGVKLEEGAYFADSGMREKPAMHMLPQYSQTWKEREERVAELAKKEEDKANSFAVVIEPLPSSDLVPERIEEKS